MTQTSLFTWGPNIQLMNALAQRAARVLVVGGTAVAYHHPGRPVGDLDLLIEPTHSNATQVIGAITAVVGHAPLFSTTELARPRQQYRERILLNVDILTPDSDFDFSWHWLAASVVAVGQSATAHIASKLTLESMIGRAVDDMLGAASHDPVRVQRLKNDLAMLRK